MSDDVIGVIIVGACLGLSFSTGMAARTAAFEKEWKCTATAFVHGKAECVEYRRNDETI